MKPLQKKNTKIKKQPPPPPEPPKKKKLGRPSKEEISRREREKAEQEKLVKMQLIELQQKQQDNLLEPIKETKIAVPTYPIFQVGDRVELGVVISTNRRGTVKRQDIGSRFAFIRWDDKGADWRDTTTIKIAEDKSKLRRTRKVVELDDGTKEIIPGDDEDESEISPEDPTP